MLVPVTGPGAYSYYRTSRDAELDFSFLSSRYLHVNLIITTIMAGRKTLLAPIHYIFSLLQKRATVHIWLYEQLAFRIEGKIRVRLSRDLDFLGFLLTCTRASTSL
jgi:hypothetical protein